MGGDTDTTGRAEAGDTATDTLIADTLVIDSAVSDTLAADTHAFRAGLAARRVTGFPFGSLERTTRSALARERSVMNAFRSSFRTELLVGALSELLQEPLRVAFSRFPLPVPHMPAVAEVVLDGSGLRCRIATESALVTKALAPLLGVTLHRDDPTVPLDPALLGGFHALVLDVAKRSCSDGAPRLVYPLAPEPLPEPIHYEFTLRGLDSSYAGFLSFSAPEHWLGRETRVPTDGALSSREILARLGGVRLAVSLFVGEARSTLRDLADVELGDVWLPGDGLWLDERCSGRGVLAAPGTGLGTRVDLDAGRIVVLPTMPEATSRSAEESPGRVALDAEVTVRIEVGQVSLSAKDWLALRVGDVVETDRPIGASVRLYVGGASVARGELVDVDGRIGVRITGFGDD